MLHNLEQPRKTSEKRARKINVGGQNEKVIDYMRYILFLITL